MNIAVDTEQSITLAHIGARISEVCCDWDTESTTPRSYQVSRFCNMSKLLPRLPQDRIMRTLYVRETIDEQCETYNFGEMSMIFLPYRHIFEIAHELTIDHVLSTDRSGQELPLDHNNALKKVFQTKAVRAFVICLYSGISSEAALKILEAIKNSDEALPLLTRPTDMSLEHYERFEKDQYLFLAPVFLKGQFDLELNEKIPIPIRYSEEDCLGTGAKATVYNTTIDLDHAKIPNLVEKCALKRFTQQSSMTVLGILAKSPVPAHPYVDKVHAGFTFDGSSYLIAQKVSSDLGRFMEEKRGTAESDLTRDWFRLQLRGLAHALKTIHTAVSGYRVHHRDIRTDNILVRRRGPGDERSYEYTLMINDWGLVNATPLPNTSDTTISSQPQPDFQKSDVEDLGVVFLSLFVWYTQGFRPVKALEREISLGRHKSVEQMGGKHLDELERIDDHVWARQISVLRGMLATEAERLTTAEVCEAL